MNSLCDSPHRLEWLKWLSYKKRLYSCREKKTNKPRRKITWCVLYISKHLTFLYSQHENECIPSHCGADWQPWLSALSVASPSLLRLMISLPCALNTNHIHTHTHTHTQNNHRFYNRSWTTSDIITHCSIYHGCALAKLGWAECILVGGSVGRTHSIAFWSKCVWPDKRSALVIIRTVSVLK